MSVDAPAQLAAHGHGDLAALREAGHVDVAGERAAVLCGGLARGPQGVDGGRDGGGRVHVRVGAGPGAKVQVVGGTVARPPALYSHAASVEKSSLVDGAPPR